MFASLNLLHSRRLPHSCRVSILLVAFLAAAIDQGLCAPATAPCTKPPSIAARLQSHPDPQAWIDLGNWFGEHSQIDCAQKAFRSGLRLAPDSAQLNYLLGFSLYESHDFAPAIPPLQRSIKADPSVLKPHLLLASIYTHLDRP